MKVKVIEDFYDVTEDLKLRTKGEELEVDSERAEHLLLHRLVEVIVEDPANAKKKKKAE